MVSVNGRAVLYQVQEDVDEKKEKKQCIMTWDAPQVKKKPLFRSGFYFTNSHALTKTIDRCCCCSHVRTDYLGYPPLPEGEARDPGDVWNLHFPGFHPEAARWLTDERDVVGVGLDTPSIDFGQSSDFETHQILGAANVWALENVANLHLLPPRGAKKRRF